MSSLFKGNKKKNSVLFGALKGRDGKKKSAAQRMIVDALVAAAVRPACMGTKRVMALFAATARAHA